MSTKSLSGRLILIVEDEALIALDVAQAFEDAGASVEVASSLAEATRLLDGTTISAAVVDHVLRDGDTISLLQTLKSRSIPYIRHTGFLGLPSVSADDLCVQKPASPGTLVTFTAQLLHQNRPCFSPNLPPPNLLPVTSLSGDAAVAILDR